MSKPFLGGRGGRPSGEVPCHAVYCPFVPGYDIHLGSLGKYSTNASSLSETQVQEEWVFSPRQVGSLTDKERALPTKGTYRKHL